MSGTAQTERNVVQATRRFAYSFQAHRERFGRAALQVGKSRYFALPTIFIGHFFEGVATAKPQAV